MNTSRIIFKPVVQWTILLVSVFLMRAEGHAQSVFLVDELYNLHGNSDDAPMSCPVDAATGSSGCDSCANPLPIGMPIWEVSQPYISLWIRDEPLGYQPGRGPRVAFQLNYKQREEFTGRDPNVFSSGRKCNFTWLSYVVPAFGDTAYVFYPGGGLRWYDGSSRDYLTNTKLERKEDEGNLVAYHLLAPDGGTNVYSCLITNDGGIVIAAFLSEKWSPDGQRLRFEYEPYDTNAPVIRLKRVIDADGRTNTITYVTSHPYSTNLISQVEDPFGRITSLAYDDNGLLTNITDVASLSSSFLYDDQNSITNMTTPYGSTAFKLTNPNNGPMDGRAIEITQPDGGKQLYLYREALSGTLADTFEGETPDTAPFDNAFDNEYMADRNSFHWNARQYPALSTTDPESFVEADYFKGTMKHWLISLSSGEAGRTLSMQREASPNGSVEGQKTWFDYEGQYFGEYVEGTFFSPLFVARVLPNGQSRYVRTEHDAAWGVPIQTVDTYSIGDATADVVGWRTNTFIYSANAQDLVLHIGPEGEQVVSNFFASGNIFHQPNASYDALNQETRYTYNANRQITSIRRPTGLTTTNIYYTSGDFPDWLQQTIDIEIGRVNSYTYFAGLVSTHTDERGLMVTNTWDPLQRLRRVVYPDATFITNSYFRLDLVKTVDRMGFPTSYGYDSMRRRTAITNALNHVTLYEYCNCGSLDSIRDAEGNTTLFFYDNVGRPIRTEYPDNYIVTNRYNALNQLTNVIDTARRSTTNWFNNQGLQYAISNAFGRVSTVILDIDDRVTNSVDANSVSVNMTYDLLGRLRTRTYPDTGVERFGYSARGMVAYTNQLDKITYYTYNEAGQKIVELNANQEVTQFSYDCSGNLTNLIDGKEQNTWWVYDEYSRVTNKFDHLENLLFRYQYDPDSRLTNRWSAAKGTTIFRYDSVHNLTNVDYANSSDLHMRYDAMKRLTNMVDGVGNTKYAYDAVGQLLGEDGPWDQDTVNYSYNNRLRASLSLLQRNATSWGINYAYDLATRMTNVTSLAGQFGYAYDPLRHMQVRKLSLSTGAYITNQFDSVARVKATTLKNNLHEILNTHDYDYNVGNQRTKQTRTEGSFVDYGYDEIGQLTNAIGKEAGGSTSRKHEQFGYRYDAAGNLNFRTNNGFVQTFNVNNLNELTTVTRDITNFTVAGTTTTNATSVTVNSQTATLYDDATFVRTNLTLTDGNNTFTAVAEDALGRESTDSVTVFLPQTATYEYDLNGNLLSDGRRGFEYDDENQLTKVTVTNAWKSEFSYDGKMRRRIRKEYGWTGSDWALTNEVRYVYDGNLVIQERDALNLGTVTYTRGKDLSGNLEGAGGIGGLLARTANGRMIGDVLYHHAFYHCDGNGNVTCLINTNQFVVAKYLYDPFGNTLSASGPLAEANLYRFSSKEFHPNSGLVYYLYRHYEPNLQRWLNRDPSEERSDGNLYRAMGNDSIGKMDPDGRLVIIGSSSCVANTAIYSEQCKAGNIWACAATAISAGICNCISQVWGEAPWLSCMNSCLANDFANGISPCWATATTFAAQEACHHQARKRCNARCPRPSCAEKLTGCSLAIYLATQFALEF